jgi:hypothetical protein
MLSEITVNIVEKENMKRISGKDDTSALTVTFPPPESDKSNDGKRRDHQIDDACIECLGRLMP